MRLIDADAEREGFMEMVYEQLSDDPDNIRANLIIDYYDSLPTVELPVRDWIPCSERLPEGCDDAEIEVLISTHEAYPDALFEETGFALYYPKTKSFHSVYGNRLEITEIVTAWKYLPEPYMWKEV